MKCCAEQCSIIAKPSCNFLHLIPVLLRKTDDGAAIVIEEQGDGAYRVDYARGLFWGQGK